MEDSVKIPRPQPEVQEKKGLPSLDNSENINSFTPPPTGIDPVPIQQKNYIQLMQEEEKPEYFQPNIIQHWQDLPEKEKPEIFHPSLIQRLQDQNKEEEKTRLVPESSQKMPEDIRAKMENAFHTDFSKVNIHEGSNAKNLNALAYTQGNDIHFAPGQFQPYSQQGQELLGHELTHILQQREGRVQGTTQKKGVNINDSPELEKEADEMGKKAAADESVNLPISKEHVSESIQLQPIQRNEEDSTPTKIRFIFRVRLRSMITSDELLILFVQQYKNVDEVSARELIEKEGWHWIGEPEKVSDKDVANTYIDINVTDGSLSPLTDDQKSETQKQFDGLSKEEKDAINSEADKQFWSKTNYKEGEKLDPSKTSDKVQTEYWKAIRAKLLQQKGQLDKLPLSVKEFLRAPENFKPENYEVLSRIADKLNQFDIADFNDYKSKVNAETENLLELEQSIDRYLLEKQKRNKDQEEKEKIATKLYGLEELYKTLRLYKSLLTTSAMNAASGAAGLGASLGSQPTINKLREELETNARKNGFSSLNDFEQKIKAYEEAFKKETVAIGLDALAKYEHILFEEEKKYSNTEYVKTLFQTISPAKAHYDTADKEVLNAAFAGMSTRDHLTNEQLDAQLEHWKKSDEAKKKGNEIVSSQGSENSILKEDKFDKEEAARASNENELQNILLKYIASKRSSISETRQNLLDTGLIFKLENLLASSYTQQGIVKDSIYDMIIQDKIRDIKITEAIKNIAVAVFSIALGLVTFGSGTVVGLAAGAGAFGLSAWQAYEEYTEYVKMNDASAVGFTEDPSLVWVVIAIAGAGLDAAAITSSIKVLAAPAKVFNETKDLAKLEKTLAQITEVDVRIKQKVLQAAKAETQYQQALADMTKASSKLYSSIIGDPEVYKEFVKAAYYAAKKGIIKFEQFLLELRLNKLVKESDEIKPEELTKMKEAFEQGQREFKENPKLYDDLVIPVPKSVEEITASLKSRISSEPNRFELKLSDDEISRAVNEGRTKGLDDNTIEDILFQGSRKEKQADIDEIINQLSNTIKIKVQGYPVIFNSLDEFNKFKTEVVTSSLKKLGLPVNDVRIQGSLLRKTNPDEIGDIDIGIVVKQDEFEKWINNFYDYSNMDKKKKALLKSKDTGIITANEMIFPGVKGGILGEIYDKHKLVFGMDPTKKIQVSIILNGGKFDLSPYLKF